MKTAQQAKQEIGYSICGDGSIERTTLYDHVMESAGLCTSPRGAEMKLHIRHNEQENSFEVWTWGTSGQHPRIIDSYATEEEAEEDVYLRTYKYDYLADDQRDAYHYSTALEAIAVLANGHYDGNETFNVVDGTLMNIENRTDRNNITLVEEDGKFILTMSGMTEVYDSPDEALASIILRW